MGKALASGGGNQRAKLLEKWKDDESVWHVEVNAIEYKKKTGWDETKGRKQTVR